MRDPKRISRICRKIEKLWNLYPDQRFGQLIENYVIPSNNARGAATCWIFYAEDEITEERLDKILEGIKKERRR